MQFHKFAPGKHTGKLEINFVAKDINIKGAYKVDKNIPSKYKNLGKLIYRSRANLVSKVT